MGAQPVLTLTNVERLAGERLDPLWRDYVDGGSGAERTLRANVEAFARRRLRQRVLRGIDRVTTETRILGHDADAPLVIAPVAFQRKLHRDGEEAMARAAAAVGCPLCLSTFATTTAEELAAAVPAATCFYQVYVFRDRGVTDELIARALAAGFAAVFLTVDLATLGPRDRERRRGWSLPIDGVPSVRLAIERGSAARGFELVDPALDWTYLERLCSSLPVPVVVKGVLEPEDARLAAAHGAAGVVVSNHGGRQLDAAVASLDALPPIVEAAGDELEIMLDGGVRRGTDVALALALGARAVLVGRVAAWGLAAAGEDGVRTVLELLRDELAVALHLTGCRDLAELTPAVLAAQ